MQEWEETLAKFSKSKHAQKQADSLLELFSVLRQQSLYQSEDLAKSAFKIEKKVPNKSKKSKKKPKSDDLKDIVDFCLDSKKPIKLGTATGACYRILFRNDLLFQLFSTLCCKEDVSKRVISAYVDVCQDYSDIKFFTLVCAKKLISIPESPIFDSSSYLRTFISIINDISSEVDTDSQGLPHCFVELLPFVVNSHYFSSLRLPSSYSHTAQATLDKQFQLRAKRRSSKSKAESASTSLLDRYKGILQSIYDDEADTLAAASKPVSSLLPHIIQNSLKKRSVIGKNKAVSSMYFTPETQKKVLDLKAKRKQLEKEKENEAFDSPILRAKRRSSKSKAESASTSLLDRYKGILQSIYDDEADTLAAASKPVSSLLPHIIQNSLKKRSVIGKNKAVSSMYFTPETQKKVLDLKAKRKQLEKEKENEAFDSPIVSPWLDSGYIKWLICDLWDDIFVHAVSKLSPHDVTFVLRLLTGDIRKLLVDGTQAISTSSFPTHSLPLLLDFLKYTFSKGGILAVMSLFCEYRLLIEHNMNIDGFYSHLLELLDVSTLSLNAERIRAPFLQTLSTSLNSSYIPQKMLKSFLIKMDKVAMKCGCVSSLCLCVEMMNVLLKYPGLRYLIHQDKNTQDISSSSSSSLAVPSQFLYSFSSLSSSFYPPLVSLFFSFSKHGLDAPRSIQMLSGMSLRVMVERECQRKLSEYRESSRNKEEWRRRSLLVKEREKVGLCEYKTKQLTGISIVTSEDEKSFDGKIRHHSESSESIYIPTMSDYNRLFIDPERFKEGKSLKTSIEPSDATIIQKIRTERDCIMFVESSLFGMWE
ncbi:Nucleolar complex protein 4 like protein [Aduncisulcus paluster]|uniref:Nucleolar complex protein 4 like protein n=1 Tax=Aduncisulcus paluster TaxID=2918883 RepID=A0ABQ5KDB9_9EUKA|nr:Nucleolar complex protein 4 like protein [Aduncisulcus paluster]